MNNEFFKEIKPYIHILSHWKRTLSAPSGTTLHDIAELKRIYVEHKVGRACLTCTIAPIIRGLVGYYERTPKKGRKKKL